MIIAGAIDKDNLYISWVTINWIWTVARQTITEHIHTVWLTNINHEWIIVLFSDDQFYWLPGNWFTILANGSEWAMMVSQSSVNQQWFVINLKIMLANNEQCPLLPYGRLMMANHAYLRIVSYSGHWYWSWDSRHNEALFSHPRSDGSCDWQGESNGSGGRSISATEYHHH